MTRAMPWNMVIAPVEHKTMVMAINAADDWAMQVRTVPINRNTMIVR